MKRFLMILITTLLLTVALCVSASASDFDAVAEELSGIGMFRGTASGFELDRAPTRSEAAIMLTRLYGAEEAAAAAYAAGEITHPFSDVSEFASPYVAWLYTNGIGNGISETEFGSARACSAQNYVVFLLRALGYKDGTDFEYAAAAEFAMTRGLFDMSFLSGQFLRDDLAAVTYQALACQLSDGSTYLLDSLIDSGAIDADAAKPITDKIEIYRLLSDASVKTTQGSLDADISMVMDMDMSMTGTSGGQTMNEQVAAALTAEGNIQMILDAELQMGMLLDMSIDMEMRDPSTGQMMTMSQPMSIGMWMKDEWMYMQEGETRYKQQLDASMGQFMVLYQELMTQVTAMAGVSAAMSMPYIDTITSEKSGSSTIYTLTYNHHAMKGLVQDIVGMMVTSALGEAGTPLAMDISLEDCVYTYTINSRGEMKDVGADLTMTMNMKISEDVENTAAISVAVGAEIDMAINASGDQVTVDYPNLTQFPDIDSIQIPADAPAA